MQKTIEKLKLTFDIKTFIVIITTVGSISFRWSSIVNKIDNMELSIHEQKIIIKEISDNNSNYWERLAWIEPTLEMIMKKLWFN